MPKRTHLHSAGQTISLFAGQRTGSIPRDPTLGSAHSIAIMRYFEVQYATVLECLPSVGGCTRYEYNTLTTHDTTPKRHYHATPTHATLQIATQY